VTGIHTRKSDETEVVAVNEDDLVFFQNASMTDASSLGSMTSAPRRLSKVDSGGWTLWEKLAAGRPEFGNPAAFNGCIAQSSWDSFTVTLRTPSFFDEMERFSGNEAGTGGLVTFKDSNWLLSVVLAHQPHFTNQPGDIQVFWGYALFPDRVGDFVSKPMSDCTGAEILRELCGHLRLDQGVFSQANCIPCHMPYITSMFMPRKPGDRPLPLPRGSRNLAFVSQFVEIPGRRGVHGGILGPRGPDGRLRPAPPRPRRRSDHAARPDRRRLDRSADQIVRMTGFAVICNLRMDQRSRGRIVAIRLCSRARRQATRTHPSPSGRALGHGAQAQVRGARWDMSTGMGCASRPRWGVTRRGPSA
jgi:hypothetical protein